MRVTDASPTLDYEHVRPNDLANGLERRGLRLRTAGRWCLACAAIAISVSAVSIGIAIVATLLPAGARFVDDDHVLVLLLACSITLPVIVALVTYPVGVILQAFGDAYLIAPTSSRISIGINCGVVTFGDHVSLYPILSLPCI